MSEKEKNNANQQDMNHILKARYDKLKELQDAQADPFVITKAKQTHHSVEIKENFAALENRQVVIAGRVMAKRVMGKAGFLHVQDRDGKIQVYVSRESLGEEEYKAYKKLDIGDIVEVSGFVFKTQTGEISIHGEKIVLLSKSLYPLPEKFHGLQDTDTRYRQRYVDLIMNEDSRDVFMKRSQILREIRNFLAGRDFLEVETPMLVENAGGAAARPFETHYNALN
ncbi:MAG: lysine--tRNA ligase, partial [Oribacterium parvum]|nr:lysine--tRNA ligase [Oribacterium parvum]